MTTLTGRRRLSLIWRAPIAFLALFSICFTALASPRADVDRMLSELRRTADGKSRPGGIRSILSPTLIENPRWALPNLNDTDFPRRMRWYAPFARSPQDRAAAAVGLWLTYHGETIAMSPQISETAGYVRLQWPGTLLILERMPRGLRIHAMGDTAPARLPDAAPLPPYQRLTILSTNDIHGALVPYPAPWSKAETRPLVGGMGSVATFVRRSRTVAAALDEPVLLLDAGDWYQGTPEGTLSKGDAVISVMNALRYDAASVGNHDYDNGRKNIEALISRLKAPVFAANAMDSATGKREKGIREHRILRRGDIAIGLTGITTPGMPTLTFEKNIRGLTFSDPIETLRGVIPKLKDGKSDIVIVISHLGFSDDKALADSVAGIDVIVGGHSHTAVDTPWVGSHRTIVVQTAGKASTVGRLDLLVSPSGGVDTFVWQTVPMMLNSFPEDPEMRKVIQRSTSAGAAEMARVIGRSETDVPASYRQESPMGRLATDVIRTWAKADVGILAGGGIRSSFASGPISVRDCFQVFPFDNILAMATVSGEVLYRVIEYGTTTERGRIQMSGVTVLTDTSALPGQRVIEAKVGGRPLRKELEYRVVTDAFLAQGGSGYFAGEKIPWDFSNETVFELLCDYVQKTGTVRPPAEERLRYR